LRAPKDGGTDKQKQQEEFDDPHFPLNNLQKTVHGKI
jgi:hypothetical protein